MNKDKTSVAHVGQGVDFLCFHIRQFKGRCYTFPQKEKALFPRGNPRLAA